MFLLSLAALVSAAVGALGAAGGTLPARAERAATVQPSSAGPVAVRAASAPAEPTPRPQVCPSYWVAVDDGGVLTAGAAPFAGSGAGRLVPAVAIAGTPTARGYWLAGADGRVAAFGDARSFGDARGTRGVTALAARPTGDGYWLVGSDGRVRSFGAAAHHGSVTGRRVAAIAPTPSGRGYWLVSPGGGVFSFGDAHFAGSAAGVSRSPLVGIAPTPSGRGYWLAAADGAVFSFGDARFHGRSSLPRPITAIAASPTGKGYWLASADGRVVGFGDARVAAPVRYPTMATKVVGLAVPAQSRPCPVAQQGRKVVFLGDSVMYDVAAALEPALKGVPGVSVASRPWFAYGLDMSRTTYDWRTEWPKVLAEESPDVVVVLAGFGDLWATTSAPADQRPETPQWRARYARVVADATRVVTAGGADLVWIGLPWVADTNIYFPNVRARVASMNSVLRDVMSRTPGATFVDAAALLAGPDGGYAFSVLEQGRAVQLRKPDGLHLCPPAARRLAQAAGTEVVRTFGERLRPGWETGAWRDDVRFHQGPALDCR